MRVCRIQGPALFVFLACAAPLWAQQAPETFVVGMASMASEGSAEPGQGGGPSDPVAEACAAAVQQTWQDAGWQHAPNDAAVTWALACADGESTEACVPFEGPDAPNWVALTGAVTVSDASLVELSVAMPALGAAVWSSSFMSDAMPSLDVVRSECGALATEFLEHLAEPVGEPDEPGVLLVSVFPPNAQLTIDDRVQRARVPGLYRIEAEAGVLQLRGQRSGHLSARRQVLVQPGATTPVALLLIPLPELPSLGGGGDDADPDSPDSDSPSADASQPGTPGGPSASLGLGLGLGASGIGGPGGVGAGGSGGSAGGGAGGSSGSAGPSGSGSGSGSPQQASAQDGGTPESGASTSGPEPPSAPESDASPGSDARANAPDVEAPDAPRRRLSTVGWALLGSGAAVLAGTAVWDIVLQTGPIEEYSELQDSEGARARELEQDINAVRPAVGALYGVGVGLAVAGVVHWAITGRPEQPSSVAVAPWLSAQGAGVQLRLGRVSGGAR